MRQIWTVPCFPMSSWSHWYSSRDHKEWWWHTSFSELSEEERKQEDSNKHTKYNLLSCQQGLVLQSHYSEQDENMKNLTAAFFNYSFWSQDVIPGLLNGWERVKSNSQILLCCLSSKGKILGNWHAAAVNKNPTYPVKGSYVYLCNM